MYVPIKSKVVPLQAQSVVRGIALSFLDPGVRRGGWSAPRPGRFTPGKDPVPITQNIIQEAGWAPGPVWTCAKNLAPAGIIFFGTIVDLFDLLVVRVTNMGQIILLPLPKEGML
jgi:hypothetical protein